MKWRLLFLACLVLSVSFTTGGCAQQNYSPSTDSRPANLKPVDPEQVQRVTMNFAAGYIMALADVYYQLQAGSTTPEARSLAQQCRLNASLGALANAADPNPVLGLMDMTLMVALTKEIAEDPWAEEQFGPENAAKIRAVLKTYDSIIWEIASSYLTPHQTTLLHALVRRWREQHPGQHFVGGARLADFTHHTKEAADDQSDESVLDLMGLDPFSGLDPAVRQVEQSRILAERMFFYIQFMPTLVSWQAALLYDNLLAHTLAQPQLKSFFSDTAALAAGTLRLTETIAHFTEYFGQLAQTMEKFRTELPGELSTVVKQISDLVATERDATLKQATADLGQVVSTARDAAFKQASDEVAAERDTSIKQISVAVKTQEDLVAKHLQEVLNNSIDRLYQRTCSVVLIAAGLLLAVLVIYRLIATRLAAKQARP